MHLIGQCPVPALHVRRSTSDPPGGAGRPKSFTLIELLIVVAILAVLISILVPSLRNAREQAVQVKCLSNLKELGAGAGLYQQDWNEWIPHGLQPQHYYGSTPATFSWGRQLLLYIPEDLFRCPSAKFDWAWADREKWGYGVMYWVPQPSRAPPGYNNDWEVKLSFFGHPMDTVYLCDSASGIGPGNERGSVNHCHTWDGLVRVTSNNPTDRHEKHISDRHQNPQHLPFGQTNLLFFDYHGEGCFAESLVNQFHGDADCIWDAE